MVYKSSCLYHHGVGYITNIDNPDDQEARKLILIGKIADHVVNPRRNEPQNEWNNLQDFILEYLCLNEPDFAGLQDEMFDHHHGLQRYSFLRPKKSPPGWRA